jgi:hypothetical protein
MGAGRPMSGRSYGEGMAEGTDGLVRGAAREAVMLELSVPARRSLVNGLVRGLGSGGSEGRAVDVDAPDVEIVDFLAEIVHTDGGFVARTSSGERALAIVAGTAAALCGEYIHDALAEPDVAFLTSLKPPAIEAVRTVLLAIETDSPDEVIGALSVLEPS